MQTSTGPGVGSGISPTVSDRFGDLCFSYQAALTPHPIFLVTHFALIRRQQLTGRSDLEEPRGVAVQLGPLEAGEGHPAVSARSGCPQS